MFRVKMFLFIYKNDLPPQKICNNRSPRGHLFCLVKKPDQFNFEALKVIQVKNRRFEHTLSKFAQQSEDPINRNFNFEAFRVIQDFSGHHG